MQYSKTISIKFKEPITTWTVTKNRYGQAPISMTYHFDPDTGIISYDKAHEIRNQFKKKLINIF